MAPAPKAASEKKTASVKKVAKVEKKEKVVKAKTVKAKAAHPPYKQMVKKAIAELKEKGGSSRQAVLKYIVAHFKVDPKSGNNHVKNALVSGVNVGHFKRVKGVGASGSFKLNVAAKEAKTKKPKTEEKPKAAAKKTAKPKAKKSVKRVSKLKAAKSAKKTVKPKAKAPAKKPKAAKKA